MIDMVVASTLMSMGMMMLPPITVRLPSEPIIFLLVDGSLVWMVKREHGWPAGVAAAATLRMAVKSPSVPIDGR